MGQHPNADDGLTVIDDDTTSTEAVADGDDASSSRPPLFVSGSLECSDSECDAQHNGVPDTLRRTGHISAGETMEPRLATAQTPSWVLAVAASEMPRRITDQQARKMSSHLPHLAAAGS